MKEVIPREENILPVSEAELANIQFGNDSRENKENLTQTKIHSLANTGISLNKQSAEDELDQYQQTEDLLLVAEMQSKGKNPSTKVPEIDNKLQTVK